MIEICLCRVSVLEIVVRLHKLHRDTSRSFPNFVPLLLIFLPNLKTHRCLHVEEGGFVEELRQGTDFAHIVEHILLELIHEADPKGRIYSGWTRGKTSEGGVVVDEYIIHCEAPSQEVGLQAAIMAVKCVEELIKGTIPDREAIVRELRDLFTPSCVVSSIFSS